MYASACYIYVAAETEEFHCCYNLCTQDKNLDASLDGKYGQSHTISTPPKLWLTGLEYIDFVL